MKISIIVAVGEKNEIGRNGDLLWRLPKDMEHFKKLTMGHHVLMGRITWDSIPPKFRPLEGRVNLVISRQTEYQPSGGISVKSLDSAIDYAIRNGENELMVIGGGEIYQQVFNKANTIYLTRVHHTFPDADTFFPELKKTEWIEVSCEKHDTDAKHAYPYSFITYNRI